MVNARENLVPSFNQQGYQMVNGEPLSHLSLNLEQVELADINYFRDLGPLSRQLAVTK